MATKIKRRLKQKEHGRTTSMVINKKIHDEVEANKLIAWFEGRQMALDFAVIALGRMGFRATKLAEFEEKVGEVYTDYSELLADVRKDDPDLWEAKAKIDREMSYYIGKGEFASWDERHDASLFVGSGRKTG